MRVLIGLVSEGGRSKGRRLKRRNKKGGKYQKAE
jgi:hypothetical protein